MRVCFVRHGNPKVAEVEKSVSQELNGTANDQLISITCSEENNYSSVVTPPRTKE